MYSPLQKRGPDGRWIAMGGSAVHAAKVGVGGRKIKKGKPKAVSGGRGVGYKGLKANFTPYARFNKRSQTAGFNAGTLIPATHKRIVVGSYVRLEGTRNKTAADRFVAKHAAKVFPKGTKRANIAGYAGKNFNIVKPDIRGSYKGHQVRLGTSRGAGPTVIIRRGKHKTSPAKSARGVQKYDKRMRQIAGQRAALKKPRPQRRNRRRKK